MPLGDKSADSLWELMASCWASEPQQRPLAKKVRDELDIINKKREIFFHETEGPTTHQISADTRIPFEPTSNNIQTSELHRTPTLNSKKSFLEKLLRRSRSSNSVVTNNHRPKLGASSVSPTLLSQAQQPPLSETAIRSPIGVLSRARWSGSVSTPPRPGHGRQRSASTLSIPNVHFEIPRSRSSSSLLDVYEGVPSRVPQLASLREPMATDNPHESSDGLPLENRGPASEIASITAINRQLRKALIIGISYRDEETADRFPAEHLKGVFEDIEQLAAIFRERSYSVETLLEVFDWKRVLTRVAQFLQDAVSGDVRAIVFAMYGYIDERGGVALVPPEFLQGSGGLTYAKWGQNIRDHSQPGVVVFSIMANAFSDQMFKQEFDRHVWEVPELMKHNKEDEPIYLTFAASNEFAYAGGWTQDSQPIHIGDHFINALVGAIRFVNATTSTWNDFFEVFDDHFWRTRDWVSLLQQQMTGNPDVNWRLDHPQTPHFSASGFVRLSDVF
ncbi:unnamed protein product [Rhizoctonia solani]|uniref:Uncharacterized protein n=1 Tax=Rhizoctonia solani TaxID=456999 RepID=A0A8H3B0D1_9AGAM|nr:unnamed protein product [Rhizoctonia solani]